MRIFESPLAPQSGIGRVIVGVVVVATLALLAWSPANAFTVAPTPVSAT